MFSRKNAKLLPPLENTYKWYNPNLGVWWKTEPDRKLIGCYFLGLSFLNMIGVLLWIGGPEQQEPMLRTLFGMSLYISKPILIVLYHLLGGIWFGIIAIGIFVKARAVKWILLVVGGFLVASHYIPLETSAREGALFLGIILLMWIVVRFRSFNRSLTEAHEIVIQSRLVRGILGRKANVSQ